MSTRTTTPDATLGSRQTPGLALAGVSLVFMAVLAALIAPVIEDKLSEGRAPAVRIGARESPRGGPAATAPAAGQTAHLGALEQGPSAGPRTP